MIFKLESASDHFEGWLEHRFLGFPTPTPARVSDSVCLKRGPELYISLKSPGNYDVSGPETTLWEPLHCTIPPLRNYS